MDFWKQLQLYTWNNAGWMMLYTMSVFIVCVLAKERKQSWRVALFAIVSGIIFYNPLFACVTFQRVFPSYKEYSRVSWLLFAPVIVSIAVAEVTSMKDNRRKIYVWTSYVLLLLIISTSSIPKLIVYPDNVYKINQDVLDVAKILVEDISEYDFNEQNRTALEENDSRPRVLIQTDDDEGHAGDPMYYGIRQYTSKVVLTQTIISPEKYEDFDFELYTYGVTNYQYFICSNQSNLISQAEQYGFELLCKSGEYALLKNTKSFSLFFVRHGQTETNVAGIYAGSGTDAMLTIMGIQQATETGEALSSVQFTNVFTSELTRTADTAKYIMNENDNTVPEFETISYLNDFYWGNLEGITMDEVASAYPDFDLDTYIGTAADSSFVSPIGSWSKYELINRYKMAFEQIAAKSQDGGTSLAVGHSAMIWYFQDVFPEEVSSDVILDSAGITILYYDRGTWSLEYLNLSADEYKELDL